MPNLYSRFPGYEARDHGVAALLQSLAAHASRGWTFLMALQVPEVMTAVAPQGEGVYDRLPSEIHWRRTALRAAVDRGWVNSSPDYVEIPVVYNGQLWSDPKRVIAVRITEAGHRVVAALKPSPMQLRTAHRHPFHRTMSVEDLRRGEERELATRLLACSLVEAAIDYDDERLEELLAQPAMGSDVAFSMMEVVADLARALYPDHPQSLMRQARRRQLAAFSPAPGDGSGA